MSLSGIIKFTYLSYRSPIIFSFFLFCCFPNNIFADYICDSECVLKHDQTLAQASYPYGGEIKKIVISGETDDRRSLTTEEKERYNFVGVVRAPGSSAGYRDLLLMTG